MAAAISRASNAPPNPGYVTKRHICVDELKEINKYNMWISSILYEGLLHSNTSQLNREHLKQHMIYHPNMQTPLFSTAHNEEFYKTIESSYQLESMQDENEKIFVSHIQES